MWLFILVFCVCQSCGEVNLPTDSEPESSTLYSPQTFPLKSIVTSNPVVLVDKKTLFIPAFYYSGNHKNVHFWVGNGTEPNDNGMEIPDENRTMNELHPYNGQNLYLHFPEGVSTDNVDYFGVWSKDEKKSLGYVNLKGIGEVPTEVNNWEKFRLPKCCEIDALISTEGCVKQNKSMVFRPQFKVFEHNETHFNNDSLDLSAIDFEPYVYSMDCPGAKYYLVESPPKEEFALLKNGSLLLRSKVYSGIFSQRHFCMDTIIDEAEMRIFMCYPVHEIQQGMFVTYITLTFISTFCFIGAFFFYFFWLKIDNIHRQCFTAYVLAMALTFLSLIIVQLAYVENIGCSILGFVFQCSMIASFTLLAILCFDIYFMVKNFASSSDHTVLRKRCYVAIGIIVPFLSLVVSLARNQTPDVPNSFFKPQYHKNSCYFEEDKQRSIFFYPPIVAAICVGLVFLALTRWKIVQYESSNTIDGVWIDRRLNYKYMFRKYLIVTVVSCIWPGEIILQLYAPSAGILVAFEIIETLQGVVVLCLFVLNPENRKLILKRLKKEKSDKTHQNFFEEVELVNNGGQVRR